MHALQNFTHLRRLKVQLYLGRKHSELLKTVPVPGREPKFLLKEGTAEARVVALYQDLLANPPRVESVVMRFTSYNDWTFTLKSQSSDGKNFSVEKKFSQANSVWNEDKPAESSQVTSGGSYLWGSQKYNGAVGSSQSRNSVQEYNTFW